MVRTRTGYSYGGIAHGAVVSKRKWRCSNPKCQAVCWLWRTRQNVAMVFLALVPRAKKAAGERTRPSSSSAARWRASSSRPGFRATARVQTRRAKAHRAMSAEQVGRLD